MGKVNICRPVIFYNNFVPPVKEVQKWRYCAFGTLDGIDVGENIAQEYEQILSSMWRHQREFCENLDGKYMAQVIYAIKYDELEVDHAFWSEETDNNYPFVFFIRVQCRGDVKALWERRADVQERLNRLDHIMASVYLTYDTSDLLIILKAAAYRQGAAIINTLRQGSNLVEEPDRYCILKNSFTVLAIRQSIIDALEESHIDDKIQQVDIRFIEKHEKGIAKIAEKLSTYVESVNGAKCIRKQVLGTDDEVVTFTDIPWKVFLSFYESHDGILNNASQDYRQFILGTTTVIMEQADTVESLLNISENLSKKQQEQYDTDSKKFGVYIDEMARKLSQIKEVEEEGLCKCLEVIVNALAKFKQPTFSDYLFPTIIRPLDCLLDLIILNAGKGRGVKQNNRGACLDFIKSFNMYTQNSIRSDRHSMQVMDLNAKIYDIPVKLNAFYNAYAFFICGLLNKQSGQIEYNFFAMPGMDSKVEVLELYKRVNENRRLIKVEIPEQNYYNLKEMMIIMAHEVAHYVGRGIRKRDYRYENYLQNIAHIYISYVAFMYKKCNREHGNKLRNIDFDMARLAKRAAVILKGAMERETRDSYVKKNKIDVDYLKNKNNLEDNFIEKVANNKRDYKSYISFIKEHSGNAMLGVLLYGLEDVFAPIIYDMEREEAKDFLELVYQITERFMSKYQEGSTTLSLETATERLMIMYEECFADLMSILLLQLTPEEYIRMFLVSVLEQGMQGGDITNYDCTMRALFVTNCMLGQGDIFSWTMEDIGRLKEDETCREMARELAVLNKLYYTVEQNSFDKDTYDRNCTNIFKDKIIIENITNYLTKCREEFEVIKDKFSEHDSQMLETIRNLYKSSKGSTSEEVEQQMISQLVFIGEYKQTLFADWNAGENV